MAWEILYIQERATMIAWKDWEPGYLLSHQEVCAHTKLLDMLVAAM